MVARQAAPRQQPVVFPNQAVAPRGRLPEPGSEGLGPQDEVASMGPQNEDLALLQNLMMMLVAAPGVAWMSPNAISDRAVLQLSRVSLETFDSKLYLRSCMAWGTSWIAS
jgi:hypothetical protein